MYKLYYERFAHQPQLNQNILFPLVIIICIYQKLGKSLDPFWMSNMPPHDAHFQLLYFYTIIILWSEMSQLNMLFHKQLCTFHANLDQVFKCRFVSCCAPKGWIAKMLLPKRHVSCFKQNLCKLFFCNSLTGSKSQDVKKDQSLHQVSDMMDHNPVKVLA